MCSPDLPEPKCLTDGDRIVGVRTGDKGIDKEGNRKEQLRAGNRYPRKDHDSRRRCARIADEAAVDELHLDEGRNPQVYALGVKEVWNVPSERNSGGWVIHTMGWPLRNEEFGGGFIYNMADGRVSVGLVIGLDYLDPRVDPHQRFQEFKTHPLLQSLLEGGTLHSYGAKSIPEGGYWAQPQYYFNGGMIIGDCRRIPEFHAFEGNPSGVEERHACRASGIRSACRAEIFRHHASGDIRNWWKQAGSKRNSGRFAIFIRDLNTDLPLE